MAKVKGVTPKGTIEPLAEAVWLTPQVVEQAKSVLEFMKVNGALLFKMPEPPYRSIKDPKDFIEIAKIRIARQELALRTADIYFKILRQILTLDERDKALMELTAREMAQLSPSLRAKVVAMVRELSADQAVLEQQGPPAPPPVEKPNKKPRAAKKAAKKRKGKKR